MKDSRQKIRVSIIIPVYNAQDYLKQCLDSIVFQDFKEIEVILVNDGSNDGSVKICDEYSNKYDFIKTIHKENEGVASARNIGIKEAEGEYLFFVDNDDWLESDALSCLITIIEDWGGM